MRTKGFDQQQALHAAMLQFWESGYEASSMQNLVDCMGISRQSLYDTYGNKRALFIQALRRYCREIVEPKARRLADPDLDPIEVLRAHFQDIVDGWHDTIRGCLLARTATEIAPEDKDISALLDKNMHELHGLLQGVIERGQATGAIDRSRSAADLAARIMALSTGLQVLCRLPGKGQALRPSVDSLIDAVRGG